MSIARPPGGDQGTKPKPYTAPQAAALLGVSVDTVQRHHADLGGFRVGERILIPRHRVDTLLEGDEPTFARATALLGLLSAAERVELARVALNWQEGGRG